MTDARGREVYDDSRDLFRRLNEIASSPDPVEIMQLSQAGECLKPASVAALNALLTLTGLDPFARAAARRSGPERSFAGRWNWQFLGEFLGWEWQRR